MQATEIGFHGFPQAVDGFAAAYGNLSVRVGADGAKYQWLTLPGEYLGRSGTFEFIKDSAGRINHRFFNPN